MRGGGGGKKEAAPPKGCMAVRVGGKGEEMQRFVVPVEYVNHPLFVGLLKESEEEYGFEHVGSIRIPCHVEDFRHVQGVIDRENAGHGHGHGHGHGDGHGHHHHHHHHHLHFSNCFKA